jgi:hypothetical protein
MTKNEFILQAMISMAGSKSQFNTSMHCVTSDAKNLANAAKVLANAAEEVAYFESETTKP